MIRDIVFVDLMCWHRYWFKLLKVDYQPRSDLVIKLDILLEYMLQDYMHGNEDTFKGE